MTVNDYSIVLDIVGGVYPPPKPIPYKKWAKESFGVDFQKFIKMAKVYDKSYECPLSPMRALYTREYAGIMEGEVIPIKTVYYKYHFTTSEDKMKQLYEICKKFLTYNSWKEFYENNWSFLNDRERVLVKDQIEMEKEVI